MASHSLWFRQDAHELVEPWFFFLSSDARLAWVFLKAYVLEASVSQKRPGIAPALDPAVAAYKWRVSVESIHELIEAATTAGEFRQNGAEWHVIDPAAFVSEKTLAKLDSAEKQSAPTECSGSDDVLRKNEEKQRKTRKNAEKVVARDTDTDTNDKSSNKDLLEIPQNDDPPWWVFRDEYDPVACDLVVAIRSAKFYDDFAPEAQKVSELLAFVRKFAPDDECIAETVQSFCDRAAEKRKREYVDPVSALKNWFRTREAQWRQVKRQREIDSSRQHSQGPKRGNLLDDTAKAIQLLDGGAA